MSQTFTKPFLALLASALLLAASLAAVADNGPLFRLNGLDFNEEDLPMAVQQEIFQTRMEFFDKLSGLVNGAALDAYVSEKAEKEGVPREKVLEAELSAPPPSEAEIKAFYDNNKARIPYPFNQVARQIALKLQRETLQHKALALVDQLKKDGTYVPLGKPPEAPFVALRTEGYPHKGGDQPAVTVVEFADYRCPHCQHAAKTLDGIVKDYKGQVALVYKDLPILPSGVSRQVAEGAVCADEQGKFWQYHDLAFQNQAKLNPASPTDFAKQLGLDEKAFAACLNSAKAKGRVAASAAEARSIGISSTPTVFVDGKRVHVTDMDRDVRTAIDRALAKKKGA